MQNPDPPHPHPHPHPPLKGTRVFPTAADDGEEDSVQAHPILANSPSLPHRNFLSFSDDVGFRRPWTCPPAPPAAQPTPSCPSCPPTTPPPTSSSASPAAAATAPEAPYRPPATTPSTSSPPRPSPPLPRSLQPHPPRGRPARAGRSRRRRPTSCNSPSRCASALTLPQPRTRDSSIPGVRAAAELSRSRRPRPLQRPSHIVSGLVVLSFLFRLAGVQFLEDGSHMFHLGVTVRDCMEFRFQNPTI
jgi:hypothetical protein